MKQFDIIQWSEYIKTIFMSPNYVIRGFKRHSLCLDNGKSKLTDVPYAGNMCFAGNQDLAACMTQCGDN